MKFSLSVVSGWLKALRGLRRWPADRRRGGLEWHGTPNAGTSTPGGPRPSGSAPAGGPGALAPVGSDRLGDARKGLTRLLDGHGAARAVWPSLALVERALGKHGWAGIDRMSPQVLHDAATVLDRLTVDGCEPGVVVLRERMSATLRIVPDRQFSAERRRQAERSTETQVHEGSFTEFMQIDREWDQHLGAAAPIAAAER